MISLSFINNFLQIMTKNGELFSASNTCTFLFPEKNILDILIFASLPQLISIYLISLTSVHKIVPSNRPLQEKLNCSQSGSSGSTGTHWENLDLRPKSSSTTPFSFSRNPKIFIFEETFERSLYVNHHSGASKYFSIKVFVHMR